MVFILCKNFLLFCYIFSQIFTKATEFIEMLKMFNTLSSPSVKESSFSVDKIAIVFQLTYSVFFSHFVNSQVVDFFFISWNYIVLCHAN